jgi:putative ABC transport system permease protein
MSPLKTVQIAIRALAKNKMRACLTVLGVVIGIAAVTTMVSIGQSATSLVRNELEGFGTNVIVIRPTMVQRQGVRSGKKITLTASDSRAIEAECPAILASTPLVGAGGQVVFGSLNYSPNEMFGVGENYLQVRNWPIRHGVFFDRGQIEKGDKVCVIGKTVAIKLFQTANPLGERIRIANKPFTIIGIMETKGANLVGEDQDSILLLPYTTVRRTLQGSQFDDVNAILASAKAVEQMGSAADQIRQLLLSRHKINPGQAPDFEVNTTTEIANMLGMVTGTMTLMLASIAGISLIVGGVGIMNIMLVSVTERTREIGIRMAVGARSRDILFQFLVESVMLSCIGGLLGFSLGIAACYGLTSLINSFSSGTEWPVVISIPAAIMAVVFSAAVGVFFGFYPARRASRLDPIEALRYE